MGQGAAHVSQEQMPAARVDLISLGTRYEQCFDSVGIVIHTYLLRSFVPTEVVDHNADSIARPSPSLRQTTVLFR